MTVRLDMELPVLSEAPTFARRAVAALEVVLEPDQLEELQLLLSELVTNALMHTGMSSHESLEVCVRADEGRIRIEVKDRGPGFDVGDLSLKPASGTRGWGLLLVDRLSACWGVETQDGVTTVWVELEPGAGRATS